MMERPQIGKYYRVLPDSGESIKCPDHPVINVGVGNVVKVVANGSDHPGKIKCEECDFVMAPSKQGYYLVDSLRFSGAVEYTRLEPVNLDGL